MQITQRKAETILAFLKSKANSSVLYMENMYSSLKSCTVGSSPHPLDQELADCWGTYIAAHTETLAKL